MRWPLSLVIAALGAWPGAAPAQALRVDPQPFARVTTQVETGWPFGHPDRRVVRYLEVHDGLAGSSRTIAAVAVRRSPPDTAPVPAFTAELAMRLSTAATTAATIAARFADNHGPDEVEVLAQRTVSFPSTQGPYTGPAPFAYVIPTDRPFPFGGGGPLCVELRQATHRNGTPTRFGLYAEGRSHVEAFGTACGGIDLGTTLGPALATHTVTGVTPRAPMILLLGGDFDLLGSRHLPLDLTAFGAPDCSLYLAPFFELRGFADATGTWQVEVPVTGAPAGAYYGAQAITVEPGLNPLGAVFSKADIVLPVTARVAGRVWAEDLAAESGVRQPVFGLVLELR